MFSENALKIFALLESGQIKSRAQFAKNYPSSEILEKTQIDTKNAEKMLKNCNFNLICCFDAEFPIIEDSVTPSERPFLFAYKGDISLLKNQNNIAVIGTLSLTSEIQIREERIIEKLVQNEHIIVSGLAKGCDTISHNCTLKNGGKTIAILPCTFDKIYPKENSKLADEIVKNGGLLLTEYIFEPKSSGEQIKRFIERDRLQAMFSESVILIASYRKGEGDSGSIYAMQKAKEYGKKRFVMFNPKTDADKKIFGLNQDLVNLGVPILTNENLKSLKENVKKIIVDMDDTLIFSSDLNNDAYNYALEKFGFNRISKSYRITRQDISEISDEDLKLIISEKQKYFSEKWMKYRLIVNEKLLNIIKQNGSENCFLWTGADKTRAYEILNQFNLTNLFKSIIFDDKKDIKKSMSLIQEMAKCNSFIIYENEYNYLAQIATKVTKETYDDFEYYKFLINLS